MIRKVFISFFKKHPPKEFVPWFGLGICILLICVISPLSISETIYENEQGDCRSQSSTSYYEKDKVSKAEDLFKDLCNKTTKTFDIAITIRGFENENYTLFIDEMAKLAAKNVKIRIYTNAQNHSFFKNGEIHYFDHPGMEMRMNFFISDSSTIAFFDSFSFESNQYKYSSVIHQCKGAVDDLMALYEMLLLNVDDFSHKIVKSKWVSGIGFDKEHVSEMKFVAGPTRMFPTERPKLADLLQNLVNDQKDKVAITSSLFQENFSSYNSALLSARTVGLFESIPFNEVGMHLIVPNKHFEQFPEQFNALASIMLTPSWKMGLHCPVSIQGTIFFTVYRFIILPMGMDELFSNNIVYVGFYAAENIMSPFYVFWRTSQNICHDFSE